MDREKQIEEMFNIIVDGVIDGEDNNGVPTGNTCANIAKALYEAGYAKQHAAGVVRVVRCNNCAVPHNRWTGCPKLNGLVTPPDFYCSYGEMRKLDG